MDLVYTSQKKRSIKTETPLLKRYKLSVDIAKQRPLVFIYEGNITELSNLVNYSLSSKSKIFTLGIRKDLECLGLTFEKFLQLLQSKDFSSNLMDKEINSYLTSVNEPNKIALSRSEEVEILSEFFAV